MRTALAPQQFYCHKLTNKGTKMAPSFMGRAAKIIAEIRKQTCIDDDVEILADILKNEFNEYYYELNAYYAEEYYNAISSARSNAYYDGYGEGYSDGYSDGHFKKHSAV